MLNNGIDSGACADQLIIPIHRMVPSYHRLREKFCDFLIKFKSSRVKLWEMFRPNATQPLPITPNACSHDCNQAPNTQSLQSTCNRPHNIKWQAKDNEKGIKWNKMNAKEKWNENPQKDKRMNWLNCHLTPRFISHHSFFLCFFFAVFLCCCLVYVDQ